MTVSRLPVEILENIFICNARDSFDVIDEYDSNQVAPSWTNVSYVCRRWRDVALHSWILWSYIPATSQRWIQELLERSHSAPLKIRAKLIFDVVCADGPSALSIVEQLMSHSQRIQELHLSFIVKFNDGRSRQIQIMAMSKCLSSHLPSLQQLEISNFNTWETPFSFESSNTPALRTLMLRCCCMPWHSFGLSALTTLHLTCTVFSYEDTIMEFLAVLRRTPHLIRLHVHGCFPSVNDFVSCVESNAVTMISLPRLSNISIGDSISSINVLLSCVDIPLTTKVELICEDYSYTHDDHALLACLLAPRISPSHDLTPAVPKFRSLALSSRNFTATLAFSTSARTHSSPSSVFSDENVYLQVCARHSASIWHFIHLPSIQSVHIFGPLSLDSLNYLPMITSMLSLPRCSWVGYTDGFGDGNQFMPALEELELYQITWFESNGHDAFCEAISTRKETQCRLVIKNCYERTTDGVLEALNLVGWWEDDQFKVTYL